MRKRFSYSLHFYRLLGCWICVCLLLTQFSNAQQTAPPLKTQANAALDTLKNQGKQILNPIKKQLDSLLDFKTQLKTVADKLKPGFQANDFSVGYSSPNSPILLPTQQKFGFLIVEANASLTMGGVPFQLNGQTNQLNNQLQSLSQGFWQMGFEKETFINNIRKRLSNQLLNQLQQPFEKEMQYLQNQLLQTAATELTKLSEKFTGIPSARLQALANPTQLVQTSADQLQQQATSFVRDSLANNQLLLRQIASRMSNGDVIDSAYVKKLKASVAELEKVQAYYQQLLALKQKIEQSGFAEKLKQLKEEANKLMLAAQSNPAEIAKLATKYLPVKGLEKLFLYVDQFQSGQSVASFSRLSVNAYSVNGLNAGFQKGKNKLAVVAGKEKMNSLFDQAALPFLQQSNGNIAGFRLGRESAGGASTFVSFFHYAQRTPIDLQLPGLLPMPNNSIPINRNTSVITIQTKVPVTATSIFEFEYARSFSRLGANIPGSPKPDSRANALLANAAVDIKFDGVIADIGLQHKFKFSYIDLGFTNPGNPFLQRGVTEGSLDLRKEFLQKKIRVQTQATYRQFDYTAGTGGPSVKQFNYLVDVRGKFKRGQYINFRYQPNTNYRVAAGQTGISGESNRLSLDGAFNTKIANKMYRHQLLVGVQESYYNGLLGSNIQYTSQFFNSMQQLSFQKFTIYCNTLLNKTLNNSGSSFFNSSVVSEVGSQLNFSKLITGSAGMLYQYTQGYNEQLGARVTITGKIHSAVSLHVFTDLRVTTRTFTVNPVMNNSTVDISIQYHFKK